MRLFTRCLLLFFVIGLTTQCKRDNVDPTDGDTATLTELLTDNSWKVDRVTDTNGRTINRSSLGAETDLLFFLNFQFTKANVVRGIDNTTKQVLNAGDWAFADDNKVIDVQVTGFKGKFKIVELTRNSLVLQQNQVQINGAKQAANIVFVPSI